MSKQKIQAGGYVDFIDRDELARALAAHAEAIRAHEEKLTRGVRRLRTTTVPANVVNGSVLLGGPEFITGPAEGFVWGIHRISIIDQAQIQAAQVSGGVRFTVEVKGSAPVDTLPAGPGHVGTLASSPLGPGYISGGKGWVTLYSGDVLIAKATVFTNVAPIPATAGPFIMSIEGWEVPAHLLWKLVL